jgi:molecular chaperone DnaK
MAPVLGIDLGTTNSVVCVAQGGSLRVLPDASGNSLIPSVVSFHPSGDVLVGHPARERRLIDARNTVYSVKRLIGRPFQSPEVRRAQERFAFELCEGPTHGVLVRARGETYTLPEISAFVLREVRRVAEEQLGQPCTRAVVTVPANFNELQRSATKAAGRVAGLDVLRILNEPTAAALAYGYGKGSRERIAVFDLGGGTFDITILELAGDVFEVLATAGDTFLGGDDLDVLIAEKMADAFLEHHRFDPRQDLQAFERLRAAAEWAKCQLSSEMDVQLRVEELAYGDGGRSLDLTFGMTRQALEQLARPVIARAFDVCEDAMRVAGVRPTQLDNVVLVGGSTRIPLVRAMVADYFGRTPLGHIDPDLVVARGAALQAAALAPNESVAPPPAPKALAKVALKKVSRAELAAVQERRPAQPAFAPPPPPVPTWEDMDDLPTRIAPEARSDSATRIAPSHDAATKMGPGYQDRGASEQRTRMGSVVPEPPTDADWGEPEVTRQAPAEVVAASAAAAGGPSPKPPLPPRPESAKPAAPPPTPPTPARRAPRGPGGNTLGFGSGGLPAVPADVELGPSPAVVTGSPAPVAPSGLPAPVAVTGPPALPPAPPAQSLMSAPPPPPATAMPTRPPLLLDVTPHTMGIETVGGFCESVIARNAAIPVEQTRIFTTGQDEQESVSVRIFQGESRRAAENQALGQLELSGLRRAARGAVKISVTFLLDADGTLGVKAKDLETGREQSIRVQLVGGIGEDEIARMAERQAKMVG